MNRELTRNEKILLGVLAVVILILGYYRFVLKPTNETIDRCNAEIADEYTKQDVANAVVIRIKKMEKEIEAAKKSGTVLPLPPYDNKVALGKELDRILSTAEDYFVNFTRVDTSTEVVRRYVEITFETPEYEGAAAIIRRLHDTPYVNQISTISMDTGRSTWITNKKSNAKTSLSIVFFEIKSDKKK